MSNNITGGCLCGAVTYTVENSFTRFYFCHCKQCRKITGSAHAANLFTHPGAIHWTAGDKYRKQFIYPNRDFTVVFCTECGSGLPFISKSGGSLIVPAGSLDAEPNIHPTDNIFWDEHAHWYEHGIQANTCSGFAN